MVEVGIRERFLQGEEEPHTIKEVLEGLSRLESAVRRVEEKVGKVEDKIGHGNACASTNLAASKSRDLGDELSHSGGSGGDMPKTMTTQSTLRRQQRFIGSPRAESSKDSAASSKQRVLWHNAGTALMLDAGFVHQIGFQWPTSVRIREGLQGDSANGDVGGITEPTQLFEMATQGDVFRDGNRCSFSLPFHPDSCLVFLVDWVRFFVLLYEIFLTPILIGWGVESYSDDLLMTMAWINGCYWIFDCLFNFATGFYNDALLIMDFRHIALHYVKTWLGPDLFLLCVDWMIIVVDVVGGARDRTRMRTVLTIARALRGVKILRLGKVVLLVNTIAGGLMSRESAMRAQLVKIPFALIIYNHIVCCAWGLIGRLELEGSYGESWLDQLDPDINTVFSQYLVSLHFTFAQMTPGPINITAITNLERALNCLLLACGLLYGSIIISQFSGHIMQITVLQRGKMQKMDAVRLFLKQREVTRSLSSRIQKQVHQRIYEETPLQFSQVQAFEHLAAPLKKELLTELRLGPLLSHMLFRIWHGMEPNEVNSVCHNALESVILLQQDQLFAAGMASHQAYLLMRRGSLKYIQEPFLSLVPERVECMVHKNTWFCEPALWAYWVHVGTMEAEDASEMLVIHSESLIRELSSHTPGARMMQHYARGYHLRITSALPPFAPWPTDLSVPFTALGDLVGAGVGVSLLNAAVESGKITITGDAQEMLIDEISAGKCTLSTSVDGGIERMVAVVALKVAHEDDARVLMHVGKHDGKSIKAVCSLPAVKRGTSELQEACFQRLLDDRLPGVANLTVTSTSTEILRMDSTSYGIPTMYQRMTTSATFEGELTDCLEWTRIPVQDNELLEVDAVYQVLTGHRGFNVYAWVDPDVLASFEGSTYATETKKEMVALWLTDLDIVAADRDSDVSPQSPAIRSLAPDDVQEANFDDYEV